MDIDSVVSFQQDDADDYTLTVGGVGGLMDIHMHTFEAVRLYNLVVKAMVGYVTEMEIAKASYERGEGPNGEAKGTWEDKFDEDVLSRHSVHADHFGGEVYRCNDPEGDWIEAQRHYADILNKQRKENA